MQKENVVIKQDCHSRFCRPQDSGIFHVLSRCRYKKCVILDLIQDLQRLSLPFINNMRGRSQIKFGMTPNWITARAFTLIELLVVVLIIGILAAVAVPQYQKAVTKARFTQLITVSKAIVDAQKVYYLEHGVYADRADLLNIVFPLSEGGSSFGDGHTWRCTFAYANGVGGGPRTSCSLSSPDIVLQWYHEKPSAVCCAYPSDNFAGEWLCQETTKKQTPYSSSTTSRCYSGSR